MTVVELRKKLEQFGPGREVRIRTWLGNVTITDIDSVKLDGQEESVIIDGVTHD